MTAPILTLAEVQALTGFVGGWHLVEVEDSDRVRLVDADGDDIIYIGDDGHWEALELDLIAAAPALHATCLHLHAKVARLTAEPGKPLANALRQIATAIGTPADVDPLADLPGLVLAVQAVAQRAESSAIVAADAVAAERMAIGAWLRARTMVDAPLARSIERGDHIELVNADEVSP
jgi:hypothetical protein